MPTLVAFQQLIFLQDRIILENQRPRLLPLDPRAEIPTRADISSVAYRRWLKEKGLEVRHCGGRQSLLMPSAPSITLYDFELSANCYKVRLLLAFLKIDYARAAVNFFPGFEPASRRFASSIRSARCRCSSTANWSSAIRRRSSPTSPKPMTRAAVGCRAS